MADKRKLEIQQLLADLRKELIDFDVQEVTNNNDHSCTLTEDHFTSDPWETTTEMSDSTIDNDLKSGAIPKKSATEEARALLEEIRNRLPQPKPRQVTIVRDEDIQRENLLRKWVDDQQHPLLPSSKYNCPARTTDDPSAEVAPSVVVKPAPLPRPPTSDKILTELEVPGAGVKEGRPTLNFADHRIISKRTFEDIVDKQAEALVTRMQAKKVDQGTQTFVTQVGKQHVIGCINCRSSEHHFKNCLLPYRPGFCHICGADGFDKEDCIYPHGIEHELTLGKCPGCSRDLGLYCPECPDCNIRHAGLVDWLRLNYATWPAWFIPTDHQAMIGQDQSTLGGQSKIKFDDPTHVANRIRSFLIRENALATADFLVNPAAKMAKQLSEEKRNEAIRALYNSLTMKNLEDIMVEQPELQNGQEIKIIIPTKYKKEHKKSA